MSITKKASSVRTNNRIPTELEVKIYKLVKRDNYRSVNNLVNVLLPKIIKNEYLGTGIEEQYIPLSIEVKEILNHFENRLNRILTIFEQDSIILREDKTNYDQNNN